MALYNELLLEFRKHHAEIIGISVDGVWCLGPKRWKGDKCVGSA
jgi:peroxiredoxin